MASVTLSPDARLQFFDNNGVPLVAGKLYTYIAGTTTLQATYSDSTGTVANANPIILNAAGRPSTSGVEVGVYLSAGASYKYVLQTSAGVAVWTQDNINAVPASAVNLDITGTAGEALTAGQVVYLSDGSGAKTAGQWYKADSANTYSSSAAVAVGMVPASILATGSGTVRLGGSLTGLTALTIGSTYYIGTAGALTLTRPANWRVVGIADTTASLIVGPTPSLSVPWTVVTTTSTGTQNDFTPGLLGNTELRCNNATLLTITGIAAGFDGQHVKIVSVGAGQVDVSPQAAGSVAANRLINFATVGNTSLAAGSGFVEYVYDATTARWRLVNHEQGAWITRTFAAGNYTASAGTWTVASAGRDAYWLKGRTLSFSFSASGTTSGTPVTVKIAVPGSFVPAATDSITYYVSLNGGGGSEGGYAQVNSGVATIGYQRYANATFSAGTVAVLGLAVFEVQ